MSGADDGHVESGAPHYVILTEVRQKRTKWKDLALIESGAPIRHEFLCGMAKIANFATNFFSLILKTRLTCGIMSKKFALRVARLRTRGKR